MKASELRASLLQEAVSGRLVPQMDSEGSAADLLQKIAAERVALVAAGKLKKEKPLPAITEEEIPFGIPESWKWVRLNDICTYIHRGKSPVYSLKKEIPVIAQKCIQWSGVSLEKALFIDPDTISKYTEEQHLKTGDLLMNSTGLGTLGRVGVYDEKINPYLFTVADSHVTVIRPFKNGVDSNFLYFWLSGRYVQSTIEDKSSGSTKQKELATITLKNYLFPLPPLAEQRRIVAKLEELLPLVDAYEKEEEALSKLNAAFPERMRKSILQEAVSGKLVPQIESEGTAADLLKEIAAECAALVAAGKMKKEKPLPAITEEEKPFEIPESWEWVRLGKIISVNSGDGLTQSDFKAGSIPVYGGNGVVGYHNKANTAPSTLIIGRVGFYCGSVHITNNSSWVTDNAFIVTIPENLINIQYLAFVLRWLKLSHKARSTAQPVISGRILYPLLLPLPPLAEQYRIVSKVEELMKIVDKIACHE